MTRPWAFWRRVQYGGGLLAILVLVGVFIYVRYGYVAPTCFDRIMNGTEQGVDCDGSCARICAFNVTMPTVVWVESFQIVDGQYNAVAYVENSNAALGTPSLAYTFSLYDDAGLIVEQQGSTVLPPRGVYPIFEGRIRTGERVPTRTTITFQTDDTVWLRATSDANLFTLINRNLAGVDSAPRLTAALRNNGLAEMRDIEVVATIFDSAKRPLTASRTFVEYFSGRSDQQIVFTWPRPIAKTLRSCEVPTDVLLAIDLSGSMNDDGGVPPEPVSSVIASAEAFVKRLKSHDQVGLVTYATDARLDATLSKDITSVADMVGALAIDPVEERGSTNTGDALLRAYEEMQTTRHNENARKVVVLLTDGLANAPGDTPEAHALAQAEKLRALDTQVFTIGLGERLNEAFLREISSTPDMYYRAPSIREIDTIYQSITAAICEDGPAVIEVLAKPVVTFEGAELYR